MSQQMLLQCVCAEASKSALHAALAGRLKEEQEQGQYCSKACNCLMCIAAQIVLLLLLQMLGMHGTVFANFAVDEADLLLAFGVRFDDRVTGKLETFAAKAKIVHIDIDPAEISKNKEAHVMVCSDIRPALGGETCSAENSFVNKAWMQDLLHLAPCSKMSSPQLQQ